MLFLCATVLAQQPDGVSFEADSVSFDLRGSSVFTGLTVTDGAVTISAGEGTTTSQDGDNGLWELRAGLHIAIDAATLAADSGTLRFADSRFTEIELRGDPVTLEGTAGGEAPNSEPRVHFRALSWSLRRFRESGCPRLNPREPTRTIKE